ncbi:MAG: hypothetical protein JWM57_919 [Phycisphaerales bacterium]|nr:hypothetical protein [Phycisphaerales bacterium]
MSSLPNNPPASVGQITKLISLGHELNVVQNVTAAEAGALIREGKVGGMVGPAPYAWKKNPASVAK